MGTQLQKLSDKPRVAIVILNWNGVQFLKQFLPSVVHSTYGSLQIIVADNQSTDNSVAYLEEHYPQIRIIKNEINEGYAGGYNTALKQVDADIYVLLNSDVEVTPGWIEPVVELMKGNNQIAACQPKILAYSNKELFEYAGAAGGWIDRFGYPFTRGRVFDVIEQDTGQYNDAQPCFWASGACLFIRKDAFELAGGFDADFFAHQEEIDLCWRLQLKDFLIYVQPASKVYHVGGGTLPAGNTRKTYLNFRNNLIMLYKNLSVKERYYKIPARLVLDGLAGIQALLKGEAGGCWAIIKAHFGFYKYILSCKKQAPHEPLQSLKGVYKGSIVWQYFVRKKTRFSEIVRGVGEN